MTDNLRNCILFDGIEEDKRNELLCALKAESKRYSKNDTVFSAYEKIDRIGVVLSGRIRATRLDINGNTIILSELRSGDIFGEALSNVDCTSDISTYSTEESEVLWLCVNGLTNYNDSSAKFMQNLIASLSQKILSFNSRINILSKKTIRERVITYLHSFRGSAIITVPFSRNDMADYLGVDRAALSRELSSMKKNGIIDYDKNSFKLLYADKNKQ